jgi:hypothetical protein
MIFQTRYLRNNRQEEVVTERIFTRDGSSERNEYPHPN